MFKLAASQHRLFLILLASLAGFLPLSLHSQQGPPPASVVQTGGGVAGSPQGDSQSTKLDENRLAFIQMMMPQSGEEGRFNDERLQKRLDLIMSSSDLSRYLVVLADRLIASNDTEIAGVLDAMAQRTDITPECIERYVSLTETTVKVKSFEELNAGQMAFLSGMTEILAAHPTPKHEQLLIRIQQIGLGGMVTEALSKSGGAPSLKALEQQVLEYDEFVKINPGNESVRLNSQKTKSYLDALRLRLAEVERRSENAAKDVLGVSKQAPLRQPQRAGKKPIDLIESGTVWLVSILALIAVGLYTTHL